MSTVQGQAGVGATGAAGAGGQVTLLPLELVDKAIGSRQDIFFFYFSSSLLEANHS